MAKSTRKHLCQILFFDKIVDWGLNSIFDKMLMLDMLQELSRKYISRLWNSYFRSKLSCVTIRPRSRKCDTAMLVVESLSVIVLFTENSEISQKMFLFFTKPIFWQHVENSKILWLAHFSSMSHFYTPWKCQTTI